ncbi:MAG: hypothetical protein MUF64_25455 [Polyangiaceae bacterium]|nr:hypothetical protein [Polyangiaceae bacterium]
MKSRHLGALLGLLALTSLGFTAACSSEETTTTTQGTAGAAGAAGSGGAPVANDCDDEASCKEKYGTKPGEGAVPPAAPSDGPPSGDDLIHAISKLYVGDTDRNDTVSNEAWKDIGFDVDGFSTTPKQGFHCKPAAGAKANDVRADGNKGIDNSFGRNIVNGILATLVQSPSSELSSSITEGSFSIVLKMDKIGTVASGTSINTQLFAAAGQVDAEGKEVAPGSGDWSTYKWRPFPEILNPDGTSKVAFPTSYVANNIWVSGGQGTVSLQLAVQGFDLKLDINKAQIAVDLSDRAAGKNGTIGGVLATTQLVDSLKKIAGSFGSQFCGESTALEGILDQVRQASDIMKDGTQNPDAECDGISIGLGFDSKKSDLGDKADPSQSTDPCAAQ